jgi:hypothetical protein
MALGHFCKYPKEYQCSVQFINSKAVFLYFRQINIISLTFAKHYDSQALKIYYNSEIQLNLKMGNLTLSLIIDLLDRSYYCY